MYGFEEYDTSVIRYNTEFDNLISMVDLAVFELYCCSERGAFDSAKNRKHQRRKRQSVTAKREKSQTPKFV